MDNITDEHLIAGRYRILDQIGKGGMSTVYLARDITLNKQWAIKEVRPIDDRAKRETVIRSLIDEANLIKRFDHPAIPRIVDLIEEEGTLYIVMDYVEGGTLAQLLKEEGAQSEENVVSWGIQLCDALDYLHQLDPPIIYRDMKPSNVMVTPDGMTRIIDFGIACPQPAAGQPLPDNYQPMGTKGYAAPEQYDLQGRVDARTDVYALGALLYVLLTGKPIEGEPYQALPLRQIDPESSEGLERVLLRAMQQNPDDRYADCAQLAYDLEHYKEADSAHRRTLLNKWRAFCTVCTLAVIAALVGAGSLMAGNIALKSDYDHQMQLAEQASDDATAERHYVAAASLKPASIAPYQGLIERYRTDEVFGPREEQQLQQVLADNSKQLRASKQWGELAFSVGKLYWYYYQSDMSDATAMQNGRDTSTQLQYERMRAALTWMRAASKTTFADQELAKLYATIADFNTNIVPLINEGSDAGRYKPYADELDKLMERIAKSDNDVMMLSTSNLVLNAVRTYPRKFRADGVSQHDLAAMVDSAKSLAQQVMPTTGELERSRTRALEAVPLAAQSITEAFVDNEAQQAQDAQANT